MPTDDDPYDPYAPNPYPDPYSGPGARPGQDPYASPGDPAPRPSPGDPAPRPEPDPYATQGDPAPHPSPGDLAPRPAPDPYATHGDPAPHPEPDPYATQGGAPGVPAWVGPSGDSEPPRGRGRTIAIIAGLGAVALLVGIGAALLSTDDGDTRITAQPAETATTPAPVAPATTTAVTPTPGSEPTTSTSSDFSPLPERPQTVDADFGYVTAVSGSASAMRISFDRAQFFSVNDIRNTNKMKRTFAISPKAGLVGTARLNNEADEVKREVLTAEVFLDNLRDALADGGPVAVWLRHTNGLEGDVTALSEQYLQ